MGMKEEAAITKSESLDFIEAIHKERVYPLMYCHIEIEGKLDICRLRKAVALSCQYVPEVLYVFDFEKYCFVKKDYAAEDAIILEERESYQPMMWDLGTNTQLKIFIRRRERGWVLVIGMSHLLADGSGFLQYLYLLCHLYNGRKLPHTLKNRRDIAYLLKEIHISGPTEQTRNGKKVSLRPIRSYSTEKNYYCLKEIITSDELNIIQKMAKQYGATLNDVFISVYARILAKQQRINKVIIPCPADLRGFKPYSDKLTVANMTGIYHRITIEVLPGHRFTDTLQQVHLETEMQKVRRRCFCGISLLENVYGIIPDFLLRGIVKAVYRLQPVSYTNIGVINDSLLTLHDCTITDCYLTGTYRRFPDFQLTCSTFKNICTLNCMLIGDVKDKESCLNIIRLVKQELTTWGITR